MKEQILNKYQSIELEELACITGGDNESYDFWYRVGSWIRGFFR